VAFKTNFLLKYFDSNISSTFIQNANLKKIVFKRDCLAFMKFQVTRRI